VAATVIGSVAAAVMTRVPVSAQAGAPARDAALLTMLVQGNVHVIAGAGANIAVQLGDLGPIVVDTGTAQRAEAALASIRALTPRRSATSSTRTRTRTTSAATSGSAPPASPPPDAASRRWAPASGPAPRSSRTRKR
jgi:hypothetical protein